MNKGVLILKWTVMCILFIFLFGWGTMWLWNWLVPALFNGPVLTFWQTLGLLVLSKILLSGFGGGGWKGRSSMRWKQHYYNKWSAMSSEDRERIKARMREKWCNWEKDSSHWEKDSSKSNSDTSNV